MVALPASSPPFMPHLFRTPHYQGCLIPFSGHREAFREKVTETLRAELQDPTGTMIHSDQGPVWKSHQRSNQRSNQSSGEKSTGKSTLYFSYAHTTDWGVLVWSHLTPIGVDLEKKDRVFDRPVQDLAKRYFHEQDPKPQSSDEFLKLWCKKEAYAKWSRQGLSRTLQVSIEDMQKQVCFESLPVLPVGFVGMIAFDL